MQNNHSTTCKSCKQPGAGNFCANCGQSLDIKRISFKTIIKEVIHFITHVDKGVGYTIKQLVKKPGKMQLAYIEGDRVKHQKPFAMYFVCATLIGLILYWLNILLAAYFNAGDLNEGSFFHKYMVLFLLLAIPFSSLITYLFFFSSKFNYAEIAVLQLYTVSMFFLIVIAINFLRLIWPQLETRFIELPAIVIYNVVTFVNFFDGTRWKVVVKGILCAVIFFLSITYLQDYLVSHYSH